MNVLASLYWDISPEIFSIGPVTVRYYGVLFAAGFIASYFIMAWIYSREGRTQRDLEALTIAMVLGTVIGARLGHCLFYAPDYYLSNPLEILKIWEGGLASHGAGFALILSLWIYSRRRKIDFMWVIDRVAIVVPLSAAFVRIGNFFNSEIIGLPADIPWAVIFSRVDSIPRHPAQLYEAISYLIVFLVLLLRYKFARIQLPKGQMSGLMLMLLFGARFQIEFFKEVQEPFEQAMFLDMGQLLSIPFILIGLALFVLSLKKNFQKS